MTNKDLILGVLDDSYINYIPVEVRNNIDAVGNPVNDIISKTPELRNKFITDLFNKVGLVIIADNMLDNKFKAWKGQPMAYGSTIEDIVVDRIKAEKFDDTYQGSDPFSVERPPVHVLHHIIDRKLKYKVTTNDVDLKMAFATADGLARLVGQMIQTLYESMDDDDFIMTKELMATPEIYGDIEVMNIAEDTDDKIVAKNLMNKLKEISDNIEFASRKYNRLKTRTKTNKQYQTLVINKDAKRLIDFDFLSGLFNVKKADLDIKIETVDGFEGADYVAVLLDERGIQIHDGYLASGSIYNPDGLYTNTWLHHHAIYSYSTYRNAVAIVLGQGKNDGIEKFKIVNAEGGVIASPTIVVKNAKGQTIQAESDGTYKLYAGTYKVTITKSGYTTITDMEIVVDGVMAYGKGNEFTIEMANA